MFTEEMKKMRNPVVRTEKWLDGEIGAAEGWAHHFEGAAISQGWEIVDAVAGETLYDKEDDSGGATMGVYVDDGYVSSPDPVKSVRYILYLGELLDMKDPGWLVHFFGIHAKRARTEPKLYLILEQQAYAVRILEFFIADNGGPPRVFLTPCLSQKQAKLEFRTPEQVALEITIPTPGKFGSTCRNHLGSLIFLVRGSRSDLAQSVGSLASHTTRWGAACDKRLTRIFGHPHGTADFATVMEAEKEPDADSLTVSLHTDSDHGGCLETSRSTTGVNAAVTSQTDDPFCPSSWISKRQSAVAPSTTDAEVGAANDGLRKVGISMQGLVKVIHRRKVLLDHKVDNGACRIIMETGASKSLKYMPKHKRISFHFLKEWYSPHADNDATAGRVDTSENRSDHLTKPLDNETFLRQRDMCNIFSLAKFRSLFYEPEPIESIIAKAKARIASERSGQDQQSVDPQNKGKKWNLGCASCKRRLSSAAQSRSMRRMVTRLAAMVLRRSNPELASIIDEAISANEQFGSQPTYGASAASTPLLISHEL